MRRCVGNTVMSSLPMCVAPLYGFQNWSVAAWSGSRPWPCAQRILAVTRWIPGVPDAPLRHGAESSNRRRAERADPSVIWPRAGERLADAHMLASPATFSARFLIDGLRRRPPSRSSWPDAWNRWKHTRMFAKILHGGRYNVAGGYSLASVDCGRGAAS